MSTAVSRCDRHGFFAGGTCPICDEPGEVVLAGDRRRQLSTFVSGALRHFPEDAGLSLDERGWADRSDLVAAIRRQYDWAEEEDLAAVVATDPKGRFEVDGDHVRAAYGHSVAVELEPTDPPVPDVLYHGTAPETVAAIRREGIRPIDRQLVHCSGSIEAAREVGGRHADDPVVLTIDAAGLLADGHRVTKRGVGVYTTESVPPAYVGERVGENRSDVET